MSLPPFNSQSLKTRVCVRCGQNLKFADKAVGVIGPRPRCHSCRGEVKAALGRLGAEWMQAVTAGQWNPVRRQRMDELLRGESITPDEGHKYLQELVRGQLKRVVKAAEDIPNRQSPPAPDGEALGVAQEQSLQALMTASELPLEEVKQWHARIESTKAILRIREGHLPIVKSDLHLDAGEICHLETPALYFQNNRRTTTPVMGRLVATNQRIRFLTVGGGGWIIQYASVMQVKRGPLWIDLHLSVRSGHGQYNLTNALHCQAVLDTLTRLAKRQQLPPQANQASHHIPQVVRNTVWQRDGGKCVECAAATYLEFDHIIPHSKGGASTVNNVQLLCRRCNGRKGARI